MLFGVETGIIGGVLTMEQFQKDYGLWEREEVAKANLEANIGAAPAILVPFVAGQCLTVRQ